MRWNMILEMARRELCKPDASTVSICSLYTIKKDSREPGNLVIFDLDRGNSQRSENSVHYSGLCGSVLEVAVDKIEDFCSVFVYFERRAGLFWRWR